MKDVLYKLNMNDNFDNIYPVSIWAMLHEIICKKRTFLKCIN